MAFNGTQNVQQAYVVPATTIRGSQTPVQLELFTVDGEPYDPALADLTGLVTQTEFEAYQTEVNNRLTALENPTP